MEGRLRANMLLDSIVSVTLRYKAERGALGSKTRYPRLFQGQTPKNSALLPNCQAPKFRFYRPYTNRGHPLRFIEANTA